MENRNRDKVRSAITQAVANVLEDIEYDGEIYFEGSFAHPYLKEGVIGVGVDTEDGLLTFDLTISAMVIDGDEF